MKEAEEIVAHLKQETQSLKDDLLRLEETVKCQKLTLEQMATQKEELRSTTETRIRELESSLRDKDTQINTLISEKADLSCQKTELESTLLK